MRLVGPLTRSCLVALAAVTAAALATPPAYANVPLTQVSNDPYTDAQAQHQTQVSPDTFQFGATIVSAFQTGRVFAGGASNIGWATSTNGGETWTRGFLPGITANGSPAGRYGQVSGPSVTFDARHNVWLISSLGITSASSDVLTSRSTNGGLTWSTPIVTATGDLDKPWIVCDNSAASPFFGNCYTQYDTVSGNGIRMKTSRDGGLTWSAAQATGDGAVGVGGQPVTLNNGTVIVPYFDTLTGEIRSFRSVDGGASWRATVSVDSVFHRSPAGGLREFPLPSAEVDGPGTVYVVWSDCGFRLGCASNDIVLAKSTSEITWSPTIRIPIDPVSSGVDHFAPGIAVDRSSGGASARIGVTYYFYSNGSCTSSTCRLNVGFISSTDGGTTWSAPVQIAGPMTLSWLPNTTQGRMFGDYISTSIMPGGNAFPVLPVASAPSNGQFRVPMTVPTGGLEITGGTLAAGQSTTRQSAPTATTTLAPTVILR
ncbi:MAG TPA: sialidase family protein [Actinophytocola sp.]|uniref:sialidase family protein n=1 Tax=Actinophytocola sp. TaxID=1872138 RepID=UPI002DDCAA19|nr:sialidase family protein [Actinophytocola sp.]HEV2779284.1 sialidase family protein [Actinophytocola sp.]